MTALRKFSCLVEQCRKDLLAVGMRMGWMIGTLYMSIYLCNAIGLWWGGELVARKAWNETENRPFEGADVMTCYWALLMGTFGLMQIGPWAGNYAQCKPALEKYFELERGQKPVIEVEEVGPSGERTSGEKKDVEGDVDTASEEPVSVNLKSNAAFLASDRSSTTSASTTAPTGAPPLPSSNTTAEQLHISLENVGFRYPTRPDVPVLNDISLDIKVGEKVSFVGESGSGKSTIIQLLERFYDPQQGSVRVRHHDQHMTLLSCLPVTDWRRQVAYVAQEPVLFDLSLRENIVLGMDPAPSDRAIWKVLEIAQVERPAPPKAGHAEDLVRQLPQKLDTPVRREMRHNACGEKWQIHKL